MPMWLIVVLILICGVVDSCMPRVTFEVTPQEFLSEYNEEVSKDLRIMPFSFRDGIVVSVDEGNMFGNLNKYTFDFSRDTRNGKMTDLNIRYNFSREPNRHPTTEGMNKMKEVCLAAIDAVDDSWITSGNSILKNLGFYANKDGWKEYTKNGIKYRLDRSSRLGVVSLSMEAVKE